MSSGIFTIDFEASCLPDHGRSFPIEVGLADWSGRSWAWLIRPEPAWRDWTWTSEAQALHGLTWKELQLNGLPADRVLAELAAVLGGQPAYADSYCDAAWMRVLEGAAGAPSLVPVRHIDAWIDHLQLGDQAVRRALSKTDPSAARHRAAADALWLQSLIAALHREAAGTPAMAA